MCLKLPRYVISTFVAIQLIFKTDNMAIVATGPGIAYMSEEPGFILRLLRRS
jgi:hypothetical protein